ncbi:hypothetical protein SAMN05192534_12322 [Alteribacillus persepolensis]|uniref:Uncharacterized protein n=1 Tax=Alteribacillus persepolensis TaxID=568899 RepID=A0A1G8I7C2_9BACI|nr:hypothetical protein [Alteribacillus persepolensis]SDI14747.1 hypothetical protein SAMN05192534_12322 [Alteribacillus persepolensis]
MKRWDPDEYDVYIDGEKIASVTKAEKSKETFKRLGLTSMVQFIEKMEGKK